ncbi:DUF2939 domain-containing protein [Janthinobacterium fluminis]|uniref:DUF2939 domain-containing protein n=1 Tax=Janthinobacterium fluminis TaxID=2987524 RepID=A0ABT5JVK7_9BURK|nr:DUF2939 domain-containing protein [Janthinobacterium fluminis]MDC8756664.1 DUF2939 domain-containing protein [Janthinobacterium fluminis]
MKKLITGGLAVLVAVGGLAYASPYFALHQIKTAIVAHDADALSEHVDFPALRENIKGQLMAAMSDNMNTPEMKENPLSVMGQAFGMTVLGPMVDSMLSPAGVVALMRSGAKEAEAEPAIKGDASDGEAKPAYTVSYTGLNKVSIHPANGTKNEGTFTLRREGLWHWKLVAIELPARALSAR